MKLTRIQCQILDDCYDMENPIWDCYFGTKNYNKNLSGHEFLEIYTSELKYLIDNKFLLLFKKKELIVEFVIDVEFVKKCFADRLKVDRNDGYLLFITEDGRKKYHEECEIEYFN